MSILGGRLLEIHRSLFAAGIPHAFGGAIALAYCTRDPRGTSDLDVSVFVPVLDAERLAHTLPRAVPVGAEDLRRLRGDGQVRLWWDDTPVDIFLSTHPFHESAAADLRMVPFEGARIPVLSCRSLAVFKAMFNRPKDWVDIADMTTSGSVLSAVVAADIHGILGEDPRVDRLLEMGPRDGVGQPG